MHKIVDFMVGHIVFDWKNSSQFSTIIHSPSRSPIFFCQFIDCVDWRTFFYLVKITTGSSIAKLLSVIIVGWTNHQSILSGISNQFKYTKARHFISKPITHIFSKSKKSHFGLTWHSKINAKINIELAENKKLAFFLLCLLISRLHISWSTCHFSNNNLLFLTKNLLQNVCSWSLRKICSSIFKWLPVPQGLEFIPFLSLELCKSMLSSKSETESKSYKCYPEVNGLV